MQDCQAYFSNRFRTALELSQIKCMRSTRLVTFARAFEIEEPLADALNCANAFRALQGERANGGSSMINDHPR